MSMGRRKGVPAFDTVNRPLAGNLNNPNHQHTKCFQKKKSSVTEALMMHFTSYQRIFY